jgi:hypothetical protein
MSIQIPEEMLTIENKGQEIVETNFWQTDIARRGGFYLSGNAGAFRLLVPVIQEAAVADFQTAKDVILTRGPWPAAGQAKAMEILFDDGTDNPYAIHLGTAQVDRWPLQSDAGRTFAFSAWILKDGKPTCAYRSECLYRTASELPCLKPR